MFSESRCHLTFSSSNLLRRFLAESRMSCAFFSSFFSSSASDIFLAKSYLSSFTLWSKIASLSSHSITFFFELSSARSSLFISSSSGLTVYSTLENLTLAMTQSQSGPAAAEALSAFLLSKLLLFLVIVSSTYFLIDGVMFRASKLRIFSMTLRSFKNTLMAFHSDSLSPNILITAFIMCRIASGGRGRPLSSSRSFLLIPLTAFRACSMSGCTSDSSTSTPFFFCCIFCYSPCSDLDSPSVSCFLSVAY